MSRRFSLNAALQVMAVCVLVSNCFGGVAFFTGLGDLPGGDFVSQAHAVSADGSVVVGVSKSSIGLEAFRWTLSEGIVGLGSPMQFAFDVSDDGTVIVGESPNEAVRWTEATGHVGLGQLSDLDGSAAHSISGNGSVIVGVGRVSDGNEAFKWTADDGMVSLGVPGPTHHAVALDVSADGSVIVGESGLRASMWTEDEGLTLLGDLGSGEEVTSAAHAVSADGETIVGHSFLATSGGTEAFAWTAASGIIGLGQIDPAVLNSEALGVSADGSIIVGQGSAGNGDEAFIWDAESGMRNLQSVLEVDFNLSLAGWQLTKAFDISDDGTTIVGVGINPSGNAEGWVATIPEPSALSLLALGGLVLIRRRQ